MESDTAHSARLETAAEEVEEARQYLIDLDRRQHQYREASRALKKEVAIEDIWLLCSGRVFVKSELGHLNTLRYLAWRTGEGEKEIGRGRDELKRKVAYLAELEGPDQALSRLYRGFDLRSVD